MMRHKIFPIALITFKEGLRHRILYGVITVALLSIIASILLSGLFMRDMQKVILDIGLSATSMGGLLIPFFLGINLLAGDIENQTMFTILAKPVSRQQYIIGKYFGLAALTGVVMLILTLASLLSVYCAMFVYPERFFISFSIGAVLTSSMISYLGILVLNSTVMLWCSITTSSFLATLLTLSTYIIGQSAENLVRFINARGEDVYIPPLAQAIVNSVLYIFPNLSAFDLKSLAAHGLNIAFSEGLYLAYYAVSYSTAVLILTVFLFNKRDLS